jgi:hypothetical protein
MRRAAAIVLLLVGGLVVVTAQPAGARGERVFLLGDSVMAGLNFSSGARAELGAAFAVTLDAKVCRTLREPSCSTQYDGRPPAALSVLRADAGTIGDALVMMVGYNDGSLAPGLDAIMSEANAQGIPHVVWLTYRNPNGRYTGSNSTLYVKTAEYPTLSVIDWDGYSAGHSGWFAGDGLHLTAAGADGLAGFLVANLDTLFSGGALGSAPPARCTGSVAGTPAGPPTAAPPTVGSPSGFTPAGPVRVADTRTGDPLGAGRALDVDLSAAVPSGADAALVTLTATGACDAGFLTAYACGGPVALASNVNYTRRHDRANTALVLLGADRHLCVYSYATTDVVVDLSGSFAPGSGWRYQPATPARLVDTRTPSGGGKRPAGSTLPITVTQWPDAPLGPVAVLVNVTAADADAPGYATLSSCDGATPLVSTLNLGPGDVVANTGAALVSGQGTICVYTSAPMDVIVDLEGWFGAVGSQVVPQTPSRIVDTRAAQGGTRLAAGVPETVAAGSGDAAIVNVTVTGADGPGFITVHSCGSVPAVSNADYRSGEVVPALAAVAVSGGSFCVTSMAATDVVVDRLASLS